MEYCLIDGRPENFLANKHLPAWLKLAIDKKRKKKGKRGRKRKKIETKKLKEIRNVKRRGKNETKRRLNTGVRNAERRSEGRGRDW